MRKLAWCLLALALAGGLWLFVEQRRPPLPPELTGLLAYVSDRTGANALYLRRLPGGVDRRLTFLTEAVAEPAFSPDGGRIAFSAEGRIGVYVDPVQKVGAIVELRCESAPVAKSES
jgi:hypothetical protein